MGDRRHFPESRVDELDSHLRKLLRSRVRFRVGGRDAETGLDCAGLVVEPLKALGAVLEYEDRRYSGPASRAVALGAYSRELRKFMSVSRLPQREGPRPGDLLLFDLRGAPGVEFDHSGWLLPSGEMIHAYSEFRGICLTDPATRFWAPKLVGYAWPIEGVLLG